tara:strand:+ start:1371 stop:2144 length:774 start_codon:yes stop_codon:yes gene_type:complete
MNQIITDWLEDNTSMEKNHIYWNDREIENKKVFKKLAELDRDKHLNKIYNQINKILKNMNIEFNDKNILSLCCGTCWFESRLLKNKNPKKLTGIDFSKYRVHDLALKTLRFYNAQYDFELIHGDVLNIKIIDQIFDIIIMVNSFHNVPEPIKLIEQIKNLSNEDTIILIIGEPFHSLFDYYLRYLKYCTKYLLNYKNFRKDNQFLPNHRKLYKPNNVIGDIHYSMEEYYKYFCTIGAFKIKRYIDYKNSIQSFVLKK